MNLHLRAASGGFRYRPATVALLLFLVVGLLSASRAHATPLPETVNHDVTLTAEESPYEGESLTITASATLHIEPGVVVKLNGGGITALGTVDATGTESSPILMTSTSDSAPGQWSGVRFETGSGGSILSHVEVRRATTGVQISRSSPTIVDSWIHANQGGVSVTSGSPQIDRNLISDNGYTAVIYSFPKGSPGSIYFDENIVKGNRGDGLEVNAPSASNEIESASVGGNDFEDNTGHAIFYEAFATTDARYHSNPIPSDITSNHLSGNGQNGIWLRGEVAESTTWENRGYALVGINEPIIVDDEATLRLGSGLSLKDFPLQIGGGIGGSLVSEGTPTEPVVFTGLSDDSTAGDTNGDGSLTSPHPGEWSTVLFEPNGRGSVEGAVLRFGGQSTYGIPAAEMVVKCPCSEDSRIADATIRKSETGGLVLTDSNAQIYESDVSENGSLGISVYGGSPIIRESTVADNGNSGVSFYFPSKDATPGAVTFDKNIVSGNRGDGLEVSAPSAYNEIETASVGHNHFEANAGRAVYYEGYATTVGEYHSNPIPPNIATNDLSGNEENGIWLRGEVTESTTWENRGYAIVAMNEPLIVGEGSTLRLGAGLVIKSGIGEGGFEVVGSIKSEGTDAEPVVFTSIEDDSLDGDTNGDGSTTTPSIGDWRGLRFPDSNGVQISNVDIRYATTAIDVDYLGEMTVTRSDFFYNRSAFEVQETAPDDPALASLPCVPPWLSHVYAVEDWFGATGYPSPSIDITDVVGTAVPEEFSEAFDLFTAAAEVSAPLYPGDNAIPFAIYSCPATDPPIPPVPVTPIVLVDSPPLTGPWLYSPEAILP